MDLLLPFSGGPTQVSDWRRSDHGPGYLPTATAYLEGGYEATIALSEAHHGSRCSGCTSAFAASNLRTNICDFASTAHQSLRLASYIRPSETLRPIFPDGSSPPIFISTQRFLAQS